MSASSHKEPLSILAMAENGYKKYNSNRSGSFALYQKRIEDDYGIKYYINIDVSDFPATTHIAAHHGYVPHVQFTSADLPEVTYNVEMIPNQDTTFDDVEAFFERMWCDMCTKYYEEFETVRTAPSPAS
jgi:hypothetical protein